MAPSAICLSSVSNSVYYPLLREWRVLDTGREPRRLQGDFRLMIDEIARTKSSAVEVFSDFCRMVACSLALQTREEEYLEVAKRYGKEELSRLSQAMGALVMEMEKKPFSDVLGPYYQEIGSKSKIEARGEFYTPPALCSMMARMVVDPEQVIAAGKPITVSDPCVGSGGMILAVAEQFAEAKAVDLLRVTGMDVSPLACDMAYINTTLWGIPATIVRGNTLSAEIQSVWKNVHWARVGEDSRQLLLKSQRILETEFSPGTAEIETKEMSNNPDIVMPDKEERLEMKQGELEF